MEEKHVHSKFENANDAESTVVKLEIIGAKNCSVEDVDNDKDHAGDIPFFAPFDNTGGGNMGSGVNNAAPGAVSAVPADFDIEDGTEQGEQSSKKVLLNFIIDQDKAAKAIEIIKNNGGQVDD